MNTLDRLWIYQKERFPLVRTVPLLIVFSAASINVSAMLAGRALPGLWAYVIGALLALILFFQLRAADEWKDLETDTRYRPERPIPRGLVSLRLILGLALAMVPVAALLAFGYSLQVLWLLLAVWGWLALMTFEFGVPNWLKARPVLYLISHMAIMPLIDLLLTGMEWAPGGRPAAMLWTFLLLSLLNGCVLEMGRKIWAPENERDGVETYSGLWGGHRAANIWLVVVALAASVLMLVGLAIHAFLPLGICALAGFAACAWCVKRFQTAPTPSAQSRLDAAAGVWVLLCYGAAGFIPLWWGGS